METKDYVTITISIVALIVSAGTFVRQYIKDDRAEKESRTPIIAITASRPGVERDFALRFQFENKSYAAATIQSVKLVSPPGYFLETASNDMAKEPKDGIATRQRVEAPRLAPSKEARQVELNIPVLGRGEWYGYVIVPQSEGLPGGTSATFEVSIRLHDNSDTQIIVPRSVQLVPR